MATVAPKKKRSEILVANEILYWPIDPFSFTIKSTFCGL